MTRSPACFSTGIGSPVSIDSSTALSPSITTPSTGTLLAGPHAQPIAHARPRSSATSSSTPPSREPPRGLRREAEQRADRAGGVAARAQLEHLPEQHQRRDDRGGLEIDRHHPRRVRRRGRKKARENRRDDAVGVGNPDAERDQREHVEMAIDERAPSALEERLARPTARPASRAKAGSRRTARRRARASAAGPAADRTSRSTAAEPRAPCSPKSAASCRRVRDWAPLRRRRRAAPAPSRISGNCRDGPERPRDASGRRTRSRRAIRSRAAPRAPSRTSDTRRGPRRAPRDPSGRCSCPRRPRRPRDASRRSRVHRVAAVASARVRRPLQSRPCAR